MARTQRSRSIASKFNWWVFAAMAAAICALLPVHYVLRLMFAELFVMLIAVELLTQRIPSNLRSASQANCYRLDGSYSLRRQSREQRALRQVRSDLWAVFLAVGFVATGCVVAIHEFVFPIPLLSDVMGAAADFSTDFRTGLRERGVDDEFFQWSRGSSRQPNSQIIQHMEFLWLTWPVLGFLAIVGSVGSLVAIRYAYLRSLSEFRTGVVNRENEYLNLDTARLQDAQAEFVGVGNEG